jgi:hypothetical protein
MHIPLQEVVERNSERLGVGGGGELEGSEMGVVGLE